MTRAYIISPTEDRAETLGLMPGEHWFEARQIKNGPLVAIHTAVIVPMEDGQVVGDVKYLVEINGRELPFDEWEHMTLIGDEITREAYNYRLAAFAWDKDNLGLHERAVVDVTKLPPVMPPVRAAVTMLPIHCGDSLLDAIGVDSGATIGGMIAAAEDRIYKDLACLPSGKVVGQADDGSVLVECGDTTVSVKYVPSSLDDIIVEE